MSRVERLLISPDWEEHFPDLIQPRLPRPLSNHFPILLDRGGLCRGSCSFKFENMCLKAKGFVDMVKQCWDSYQFLSTPSFILANKLKWLKLDLKRWNKEVFGNIVERKKSLLEEI